MEQKKVALALGSGGARGLAHIGVIEELKQKGFKITSVSGCSIGSLIGGFYAMGKLKIYSDWICSLKKREVYSLLDPTFSHNGLVKGEKAFNKMKEMIPDIKIEDMKIPFSAVTTDIFNRKEVVITTGSFYSAARASISIPAIFTPFNFNGRTYVDGGLLNPIPVNHVKRTENDILVAVNLYGETDDHIDNKDISKKVRIKPIHVNSSIEFLQQKIKNFIPKTDKQSQGYLTLLQLTSSMMLSRISNLLLTQTHPDILINIPANSARTFDFHKSHQLIKMGRESAKAAIHKFNSRK